MFFTETKIVYITIHLEEFSAITAAGPVPLLFDAISSTAAIIDRTR